MEAAKALVMTMHVAMRPTPRVAPGLGLLVQLVVSDPERLALLKTALERSGAVVHAVCTPAEALSIAAAIDIDVLVCDLDLEGMDGCTLLQRLRHLRSHRAPLPAIALAPRRDEDEISGAFQAGFLIHAIRPEPQDLVRMVTSLDVGPVDLGRGPRPVAGRA